MKSDISKTIFIWLDSPSRVESVGAIFILITWSITELWCPQWVFWSIFDTTFEKTYRFLFFFGNRRKTILSTTWWNLGFQKFARTARYVQKHKNYQILNRNSMTFIKWGSGSEIYSISEGYVRLRFRRGSLRDGYYFQGRQQARKLPNQQSWRQWQ